jgi:hypothetical protein
MKSNDLPKARWHFRSLSVEHRPRWTWKRVARDGNAEEASDTFPTLSGALADARRRGFDDAYDEYSIV